MTVDPTVPATKGEIDLSVVIITENEEDQVKSCIDSVFDACQGVGSFEVILVDSASTDRTVEYATEFPITVLRIPEEHTVSCGAGRFVGDQVARGDMVLHVDGDMTLTETWLPEAIEHLEAHADVAAVEGNLDRSTQTGVKDVDKVGGVMLYDAHALEEIGGFDPYLLGYEDIDVGFQLRHAGYRLVRLPEVSAMHHDDDSFSEPVRRWRQGYYVAPGQTIRKWLGTPSILLRLLRRQRFKFALFVWVLLGLSAMVAWPLLLGWLILTAIGFGVVTAKQGFSGAVRFFTGKAVGVVGLLAGLLEGTRPADEYPLESVEVVAAGQTHGDGRQTRTQ